MSHTKEPWHVGEGNETIVYDADGWGVCSATVFHAKQAEGEAQKNSLRIAVCVNACAGIETDVIQQNENKVSILLTQRDELLKFAQSIKDYAEKYPHDVGIYDHVKYELSTLETPL